MRINLTKKDLVNIVYMQRFSKNISEIIIDDFLTIMKQLKKEKNLKYQIWYFFNKRKKQRIGRNQKLTKKIISNRKVVYLNLLKNLKNLLI